MRILFFIPSLGGGGAERVLSIICNNLVKKGYNIIVATDLRKPIKYKLDKEICIVNFSWFGNSTKSKIPEGIKLHFKIKNIITSVNPDVVVSFLWILNIHIIIANLFLKKPIIVSEHFTFDRKHNLFSWFARFHVNKLADKVTVLTDYDMKFLGNRLKNKVRMSNPLSYSIIHTPVKKEKTILAVGSLDRWKHKGFDNLINVWSKVHREHPTWTLKIAGGGNEKSSEFLKNLVRKHDVESGVEFLGFRDNIDELMRKSSIFVLSSRFEGLPMVLIEAMSQGCTCVSFDCISGPREIITDGESGLLVADQNLKALEKSILLLIQDETLRKKISHRGLAESKNFHPDLIVKKWEDLFAEVI